MSINIHVWDEDTEYHFYPSELNAWAYADTQEFLVWDVKRVVIYGMTEGLYR